MLHGTTLTKLQSIVKHGLRTKFGKKDHNLYGSGLYFADAACKAAQYCAPAHGENIILVCRVIIGRSHLLRKPSDDALRRRKGSTRCAWRRVSPASRTARQAATSSQ